MIEVSETMLEGMLESIKKRLRVTPETQLFHEWLQDPTSEINPTPRWYRLCFLVAANGSFEVGSWGFLSSDGIHQIGLEQDDALELMFYSGMFAGASQFAPFMPFEEFKIYFDEYRAMVDKLRISWSEDGKNVAKS